MRKFRLFSSLLVVVFFISFVSFNLESENFIQLGSVAWGEGTCFYYEKYTVNTHNNYCPIDYNNTYLDIGASSEMTGYLNYAWDSLDMKWYGLNWNTVTSGTCYYVDDNCVYEGKLSGGHKLTRELKGRQLIGTTDLKGSLVQSKITALNGTYPDNGKYTDGYWYVKGTIVPPIIVNLIIPTQNAALFPNLQTPERSA
jgi:hypothetical protein